MCRPCRLKIVPSVWTFSRHRAFIYNHLVIFEKSLSEYKKLSRSQVNRRLQSMGNALVSMQPDDEGKWIYHPIDEQPSESEPEPDSKRQKIELSPDEVCVICLEKRKTHAFLHANLTKVRHKNTKRHFRGSSLLGSRHHTMTMDHSRTISLCRTLKHRPVFIVWCGTPRTVLHRTVLPNNHRTCWSLDIFPEKCLYTVRIRSAFHNARS